MRENPGAKIIVIDTLKPPQVSMFVMMAVQMKEGKAIDEQLPGLRNINRK